MTFQSPLPPSITFYSLPSLSIAFQASKGKVDYAVCPTDAMDELEARPVSENVYRSGLLAKRCHASIVTVISMIIRLG